MKRHNLDDADTSPLRCRWVPAGLHYGICFLLVTVPLVPYRYLILPDNVPSFFLPFLRYTPLLVSLALAALWAVWRWGGVVCHAKRTPLSGPVWVLFLAGAISSVGAENPGLSLSKEIYYFLTGGALCLVVADFYMETRRPEIPVLAFLITAYTVSAYGIFEFASGGSPIFHPVFSTENDIYTQLSPDPWFGRRIVSSIGHPVYVGAYLVLAIPVSLWAFFRSSTRLLKAAYLTGTLVLFAALMLSFTRGAWAAGAAGVAVYLRLRGLQHTRYLLGVLAVAGICIVLLLSFGDVSEVFHERVRDAYDQYVLNFASTSRGKAFGHVAEMTARYPLLGVGTGMYRFKAYILGRTVVWPPTLDTPDNMYLLWLAEHGALGLFAVGLFLVRLFRILAKAGADPADLEGRELSGAFAAGFAGFCVDMLTCSALYFPVTRVIFWMLAGLSVAATHPHTAR